MNIIGLMHVEKISEDLIYDGEPNNPTVVSNWIQREVHILEDKLSFENHGLDIEKEMKRIVENKQWVIL